MKIPAYTPHTSFISGPLDVMGLTVEQGQIFVQIVEVRGNEEIKHFYSLEQSSHNKGCCLL